MKKQPSYVLRSISISHELSDKIYSIAQKEERSFNFVIRKSLEHLLTADESKGEQLLDK